MEDKNNVVEDKEVKHSESKRKWLKGVGAGAPLALLLTSRSTLAATCSISGFVSDQSGSSLSANRTTTCNGWSPGNWKNDNGAITAQAWADTGVGKQDSFNSWFNTNQIATGGIAIEKFVNNVSQGFQNYASPITYSIFSALSVQGQGADIVKHATATLLNSRYIESLAPSQVSGWMINYSSWQMNVGFYLLAELDLASNNTDYFILYKNGLAVVDTRGWGEAEYKAYFVRNADGDGTV